MTQPTRGLQRATRPARPRPVAMLAHSYYEEDPRVRREAEAVVASGQLDHDEDVVVPDSLLLGGVHGPGESTMRCGRIASICSHVNWSLRRTTTSSPISPRYWTRL